MAMATFDDFTAIRHLRPPVPLHFPAVEEVGETKRHLELRTALYFILKRAAGEGASVGSDQFLYWDAAKPSACLSPDAFVRLGAPDELFDTWKVWERGAPHLAVEVVSRSDARDAAWEEKAERYRSVGISEVVRFDPEDEAQPLRVFDHVDGDLVERDIVGGNTPCRPLGLYWVVVRTTRLGLTLRLARDSAGKDLIPADPPSLEE